MEVYIHFLLLWKPHMRAHIEDCDMQQLWYYDMVNYHVLVKSSAPTPSWKRGILHTSITKLRLFYWPQIEWEMMMVFLRVLFSFEFGVVCVVPVPYLFHEQSTCKAKKKPRKTKKKNTTTTTTHHHHECIKTHIKHTVHFHNTYIFIHSLTSFQRNVNWH